MIRTGTDRLTDYAHYHKPSKSKNTITKGTYHPMRTHPANTDHNGQRIDNNSREHHGHAKGQQLDQVYAANDGSQET